MATHKAYRLNNLDLFDDIGDLPEGDSFTSNWERRLGLFGSRFDHDSALVAHGHESDPNLVTKHKLMKATRRLARTVNILSNAVREEGEKEQGLTLRWKQSDNEGESKNEILLSPRYVTGDNEAHDALVGSVLIKQGLKRTLDRNQLSQANAARASGDEYQTLTAQLWETVETAVSRNATLAEYPGSIHYFKAHAKFNGAPSKKVLEDSLTYGEPSVEYAVRALQHRLMYPHEKLNLPAYYENAIAKATDYLADKARMKTKRFASCAEALEMIRSFFNVNPPPPPPPMPQPPTPSDDGKDEPGEKDENPMPGSNNASGENNNDENNQQENNNDEQDTNNEAGSNDSGCNTSCSERNGGGANAGEQPQKDPEQKSDDGDRDPQSKDNGSSGDGDASDSGSQAGEAQPGEEPGDTEGDGTDDQGGVSEEVGSDTESADDSSPDEGDEGHGSDDEDSGSEDGSESGGTEGQESSGESGSSDSPSTSDSDNDSESSTSSPDGDGQDDGMGGSGSAGSEESEAGTDGGSDSTPEPDDSDDAPEVKPASQLGNSDSELFGGQPKERGQYLPGSAVPDAMSVAEALKPVIEIPDGLGFPTHKPHEHFVEGKDEARQAYEQIVAFYRPQINRIVNAFSFRNEEADYYEHGLRTGEIDDSELHLVATPQLRRMQPRIFKEREVMSKPNIAIGLLVDMSGSMGSSSLLPQQYRDGYRVTKAMMARDAAIVLQNAFAKIAGIQTMVLGFTHIRNLWIGPAFTCKDKRYHGDDAIDIIELLTKEHKNAYALAGISGHGDTPTSFSLEFAARKMAQDYPECAHRYLFQITDGDPWDVFNAGIRYGGDKAYEHTKMVCEFADRYLGVRCYGIGVCNSFTQQRGDMMYRPHRSVIIDDVLSCVPIITAFLRRIAAHMQ